VLSAEDVRTVVQGVEERGAFPRIDAVLSGFQGDPAISQVLLDTMAAVKQANPAAVYCCDPVMGDVGRGFFVRPGIPEFLRDTVVPQADIVTPNLFELEFLTGVTITGTADLLQACAALREQGPRIILVTSAVLPEDDDADEVGMVLSTPDGAWRVSTPRLDRVFSGSGDITAAVFLSQWLSGATPTEALERTAARVYGVLRITTESGQRELQLVAAQDELIDPRDEFRAVGIT
jgi:pyridoxine kinase